MRVDVIESYETLLGLKSNWDAVYERDPEGHFFLSWTWISRWLDGDRSQWFVLAAAPGQTKEYVAFFPLRLRTKMHGRGGGFYNELTLAGRGLSDYTGLISLPDCEADAIAAFGRYLRRSNWAVLNLEFVRASPRRVRRLLEFLPAKTFRTAEVETINKRDNINNSICPFASLPNDWEAYLTTLGSNTRQKMRRFLRKVEGSDEFRITTANAETIERDLDILLNFWSIKWKPRKGDRIPGLARANRSMFMACFEADALFVPVMWQGERPLGALATYVDRQKRTLLFFMGARDETITGNLPPGFVLHAFSIRYAIENGFQIYDFLRGNEEYKYLFGVEEVPLRNLVITAPRSQNLGGRLDPRCVLKVLNKTLQLHKDGKLAFAERGYRQVLDVTPNSPAALYGYGQLLAKKGDHRGAVRFLRKLIAIKPESRNAWLRIAVSLEAQHRFADAEKAYREILKQWPADTEARLLLGRMLLALRQKEEAINAFETAAGLRQSRQATLH